jgi:hypothetical protein
MRALYLRLDLYWGALGGLPEAKPLKKGTLHLTYKGAQPKPYSLRPLGRFRGRTA